MSAVHGHNFFSGETKACGVQTTVQGRGEGCPEPDATTKITIFRVVFPAKPNFKSCTALTRCTALERRARDSGQCI